jgi:nucleoside-diphosphate-sugar epimerase
VLTHHVTPAPPARVVLIGARGFIAMRLRAALETAAIPIEAIGSKDVDLTAAGAADALASKLREGDSIVFLSALTPDRGKGIDTLMANVAMGGAVCTAVGRVTPGHLVYLSSDAVYRDDASKVDEHTPTDGVTLYGSMHALRERMLMAVAGGVPLAILRPTLVFGVGDTHNAYGPNRFMRAALKDGVIPIFGDGDEQRDHIHVDDLVRLIQAVLVRRSSGVLNLITGQSTSFGDLARKVASLAGGVKVESRPRAPGPILHRHFDPTALLRAFPDFRFTPRDAALAAEWAGFAAVGRPQDAGA